MDSSSLPLKPYAYTSVNCANPTLLLNGTPVPVVEETKFLGVIFDCKLSFIPHIKHLTLLSPNYIPDKIKLFYSRFTLIVSKV